MEPQEAGPAKRGHWSNLRPFVGPAPKRRCHAGSPVGESTSSLGSENKVVDPEFVLVEEVSSRTSGKLGDLRMTV